MCEIGRIFLWGRGISQGLGGVRAVVVIGADEAVKVDDGRGVDRGMEEMGCDGGGDRILGMEGGRHEGRGKGCGEEFIQERENIKSSEEEIW